MGESTHPTGAMSSNIIVTHASRNSGRVEAFLHLLREVFVLKGTFVGVFVLAVAGLKMQADFAVFLALLVLDVALAFLPLLGIASGAVRTPRLVDRPWSGAVSVPTIGSAAVSGAVTSVTWAVSAWTVSPA